MLFISDSDKKDKGLAEEVAAFLARERHQMGRTKSLEVYKWHLSLAFYLNFSVEGNMPICDPLPRNESYVGLSDTTL